AGTGAGRSRGRPQAVSSTTAVNTAMRVRRMSAQVRAKRCTCQRPSDMRIESADACILSRFRIRLHVETKMNVEKDKVATFHYHLTDAAGEVIDSSREAQPLTIL